MSKRVGTLVQGAACLALLFGGMVFLGAETPTTNIGKQIPAFRIKVENGGDVSLADFKESKAIVVVFLGTECPLNNAFLPRLADLHKEFAPRGVQFLGINANRQDSAAQVAAHAKKHAVPFPVLKDEKNSLADTFAARRTPEAFILDSERKVRYQGRIDDQFGTGYNRPKPTRRDLAEALEEILAGKPVSVATTPISGCLIARVPKTKDTGSVTFSKHVATILQNKCQECHRPQQIGPMPLVTYDDAASWSATIHEVVQENRMPPWHADPRYGKFANDRRLSVEEKATLLGWIDQGMPKGDDKDLPPPRVFAEGWRIGKPDLVLTMPDEFAVPAVKPKNGIPYKHFFIDPGFTEDRWVERAEAKPSAPAVVHHIVVFIVPKGESFFPGSPRNPTLAGTAPGDMPLILAPGTAKKIPAGAKLVMQLHYTPNGVAYKDRSSLALIFAKKPPERSVHTIPIANLFLRIPPGADDHKVESIYTFKKEGRILDFMPHMHLRGKDFLFEAIYPDGKKEILLAVPRFDFNWQSGYRLAEPRLIPKGTKIHCVAHFDNSEKNFNNPDSTKTVTWGDQTWEEMMIGWVDLAYDRQD